jgi:flavin-dependent dehydrogenase
MILYLTRSRYNINIKSVMKLDILKPPGNPYQTLKLIDGSKVVIIGGGPSGSFFALNLLRKANKLGRKIEVFILEKKPTLSIQGQNVTECFIGECNYCAGGLSPRVCDALTDLGLDLPPEIILDTAEIINVFADWKTISLDVLRDIKSVYRGSRPKGRTDSNYNFDNFLLSSAANEGAKIINAEVTDLRYSREGKIIVSYNGNTLELVTDFVAFAGGVNGKLGHRPDDAEIPVSFLKKMIPRFELPEVRKTIIFELSTMGNDDFIQKIKGELYFILHGSDNLKLEMISIVPKGEYITVVLIGKCIDKAKPKDNLRIIDEFMHLPHIKTILPEWLKLKNICVCSPFMTTGVAKEPFGDRIVVIGDMFTSNLYKDGIGSAFEISANIAEAALSIGIDKTSLRKGYMPVIRKYKINNILGKLVFLFIRICFSNVLFSRIIYQAVITERKTQERKHRKLEKILWNIASGEDNYRNIILNMYHPFALWSIIYGGFFITLRNSFTELVFGLKWGNFSRLTTGVAKELFEEKTEKTINEFWKNKEIKSLDFKSMYTIRISSTRDKIFSELGKFGDIDRKYFNPRFIKVSRISGEPNAPGSIIRYNIFLKLLSFNLRLVKAIPGQYIRYEILDGFGRGGILLFEIDGFKKENKEIIGEQLLSIFVGFNFSSQFLKIIFPSFMHDVLWNHSLCQLKSEIE